MLGSAPLGSAPLGGSVSSAGHYTLSIAPGVFAINGAPVSPSPGYIMSTTPGSFVLTGQASTIGARIMFPQSGTFTIGTGGSLLYGRKMPAAGASYTLTGATNYMNALYLLTGTVGGFNVNGRPSGFLYFRGLTTTPSAFTLNGANAKLLRNRPLPITSGTFGLTGATAGLLPGYTVNVVAGSFVLTTPPSTLKMSRKMTASVGAFALNGPDSALKGVHGIKTALAPFLFDGLPAALLRGRGAVYAPGAFSLTGRAASLQRVRGLSRSAGVFALSGATSAMGRGRRLVAQPGSFSLLGSSAGTVEGTPPMVLQPGAFVLAGQPAALKAVRKFGTDYGVFKIVQAETAKLTAPGFDCTDIVIGTSPSIEIEPGYCDDVPWYVGGAGNTGGGGGPTPPASDGTIAQFQASGVLSGHRIVCSYQGKIKHASQTSLEDVDNVVGMTLTSASPDELIGVKLLGITSEPSWNWTVNDPVFLGADGQMTQTAPTTGVLLVVGLAASQTSLFISIKPPVIL